MFGFASQGKFLEKALYKFLKFQCEQMEVAKSCMISMKLTVLLYDWVFKILYSDW